MKKAISIAMIGMMAISVHAAEWFVDASRPNDDGDGAGWATAKKTIQAAIDLAGVSAGHTIWVTNGVYDEGGAYASGETVLSRVYVNKAVTLRAGNTNPAATVIEGRWHDPGVTRHGVNAVRCVWMTNGASLIGFTLTNGATQSVVPDGQRSGGGIFASGGNVMVSNCVFVSCSAHRHGGGAYRGRYYDCLFRDCYAAGGGGAADGDVAALFQNCVFSNNYSTSQFGGSLANSAATVFSNCLFVGNSANLNGAAAGGNAGGTHYSSVIYGNTAGSHGGGVSGGVYYDSDIFGNISSGSGGGGRDGIFHCCRIHNNTASGRGGGVIGSVLYDCAIYSNYSTAGGGGGVEQSALYRCLIYGNTSAHEGGGTRVSTNYSCGISRNVSLNNNGGGVFGGSAYNSLIAGNQGYGMREAIAYNCVVAGNHLQGTVHGGFYNSIVYHNQNNYSGTPVFYHSCTFPELPGWAEGNITNAPMFLDHGSAEHGYGTNYIIGTYHLRRDSPCINKGAYFDWMDDPDDPHGRSRDMDGNPRIRHGAVDMGAYELRISRGTTFSVD